MNVNLPQNLVNIRSDAFMGCSSLTHIVIPAGVDALRANIFRDCTSLSSINIPGYITYIGENCFDGCSNLNTVYYGNTVEKWDQIEILTGNDPLLSAFNNMEDPCGGFCGDEGRWSYANGVLTLSGSGTAYDYRWGNWPWNAL